MTSVGKDRKQLKLSFIACGNVKWYILLKNILTVSYISLGPSTILSTPKSLLKRNKNICPICECSQELCVQEPKIRNNRMFIVRVNENCFHHLWRAKRPFPFSLHLRVFSWRHSCRPKLTLDCHKKNQKHLFEQKELKLRRHRFR